MRTPPPHDPGTPRDLQASLAALREENRALQAAHREAAAMLSSREKQFEDLLALNRRLASANASSAELLVALEEKNRVQDETNRRLARANAEAAELMAENELKNEQIQELNRTLSRANAHAAEMLAEIDEKNRTLRESNQRLAQVNAEAAELMAEIELKKEQIEKLNRTLSQRNEEILLLSVTDPLTGIYNRSYLNQHLPAEIARARRYGRPLSILIGDIDHFKEINDRHGHQAGDRVLQAFARCLRSGFRKGLDWVVRYGGEEFLVVLPETAPEGAAVSAERVRRLVEEQLRVLDGLPVAVTVSFGVAGIPAGEEDRAPQTLDGLIGHADRNLYRAKRAGRNRVVGGP